MKITSRKNSIQHLLVTFAVFSAIIGIFFSKTCLSHESQADATPTLLKTADAFASIIEQAKPAVVNILVKKGAPKDGDGNIIQQDFFEDQLMKDFFGSSPSYKKNKKPAEQKPRYGNGSGFIISENGHIITNNHVVADAVEITVYLQNKREYSAKLIGTDSQSDIALLKIDAFNLPLLRLGDSDKLRVGEWAIAIGSPLEFIQTVTVGIISAKGRSSVGISEYEDFIQTDAVINPGNSGGPLLNIHGEVIGINTAFITQTGGYMGVGFAVPSNMAKTIIRQLEKHHKVTRGWLGVALKDVIPAKSNALASWDYQAAARVVTVSDDSPASSARLKKDDLIVALNGVAISGAADLRNKIALTVPGTGVKVEFLRAGKPKEARVEIGALER